MRTVRIGLLDEEEDYVSKLAGYLNRQGRGCWNVAGFTDKTTLEEYLEKRSLDVLAATNLEEVLEFEKKYKNLSFIWLSEDGKGRGQSKNSDIYMINRYQSAKAISKTMNSAFKRFGKGTDMAKPMAAVYSPVGRCGKTTFALEIVKNESFGRWLYIGMEDYSSFRSEEEQDMRADTFLYFVKERQKEKALNLIAECNGIIPTAFSIFDVKQIGKTDIEWIGKLLQEESSYHGVIFDIGSAMLQDFDVFSLFDIIVVPFLSAESSLIKKEQFEKLLYLNGLEEVISKLQYINMENSQEILEKMEELFSGTYGN